jgi:hypothetical protein
MAEKTIEISVALLELLAPEQPLNDYDGGCVWCGWSEEMKYYSLGQKNKGSSYADNQPENHRPDCPWVQARILLELKKG